MPGIIFLCILMMTVGQWSSLRRRRRDMYRIRMERQASRVSFFIEKDLESREKVLQRTAERWDIHEETALAEFTLISADLLEDKPGFHAIKWVDSSYRIRWISPQTGNENLKERDFNKESEILKLMEISRNGQSSVITPLRELGSGVHGFRIFSPLFTGDRFVGFLMARLHAQEWLNTILKSGESSVFYKTIIIQVEMDGESVYQSQDNKSPFISYGAEKKFTFKNHNFIVRCTPREDFFEENEKDQSILVLILGILHALTLAGIFYLLQNSSTEKLKKLEARSALEKELQFRHMTERELTELNTRLTLATRAGRIGVWTWDLETDGLEWNDIMFDLYGLPADCHTDYELWRNSIHPEDRETVENLLQSSVKGTCAFDTSFRIHKSNGTQKILRAASTVTRNRRGEAILVTGVSWDITESVAAQEKLEDQRYRLEGILEGTNVGTWEWNIQSGETVFNERWADIIGYRLEDISPVSIETWVHFTHPADLKKSDELLQRHFKGELPYYECEARMKHRNGHWVWVLDRGKVTRRTPEGEPLLMSGTHTDITERKSNEEKIHHMAVHDALTDLPTLRLARDRLNMAMHMARRNNSKTAVMFIDLDGFKGINDNFGHDVGDEVLIRVAHILQSCIRESDTAARMGGDEFLVLLTEINSPENARIIAEKLIRQLSSPFPVDGKRISISASIGISLFPENGNVPEDLIRNADRAMYRIKNAGKNGFTFA